METIDAFRALEFDQKCDLIFNRGQYLALRYLGECKVLLYSAGNFFVEVFYSMKYQRVLLINAFDHTIGLEPYLAIISLTDLNASPMI